MDRKKIVADYFTFTRGNRIAILAILVVLIGIFFMPDFLIKDTHPKLATNDTSWIVSMKQLEQKETDKSYSQTKYSEDNSFNYQYDRKANNYNNKTKGELFDFDPNTISAEGWKRLGLRDKTIGTIQNYLNKGGKFRNPEDLSRIYGLFPNEYERIAPYIKIQTTEEVKPYNNKPDNKEKETVPVKNYSKNYAMVDINTADANELVALPGIGPSFSTRIISFRDKLGGFYSINQVAETFGLPDSTFQKIKQFLKLENTEVRKININTATVDELKNHPYIRYNLANPIIAYRNQHGQFSKVEDIKKIMIITDEIYTKISPYLTL